MGEKKAERKVFDELEEIDGSTGFAGDNKNDKTSIWQGNVYGYDRLRPEVTGYIEYEIK